MKFIEDLSREAISGATHDWTQHKAPGDGPAPVLSDGVHSLLASWAVAFFLPRGIRVYAAQDGLPIIPPPLDHHRRGFSRADVYSSDDLSETDGASESDESRWSKEEREARRRDVYLPRRERALRSQERERERRRERRKHAQRRRTGKRGVEWEVHFVSCTPTIWQPGARPRTYGEPMRRHVR